MAKTELQRLNLARTTNITSLVFAVLLLLLLAGIFGGAKYVENRFSGKNIEVMLLGHKGTVRIEKVGLSPISGVVADGIKFELDKVAKVTAKRASVGWSLGELGKRKIGVASLDGVEFSVELDDLLKAESEKTEQPVEAQPQPTTPPEQTSSAPVQWELSEISLDGKGVVRYGTFELVAKSLTVKGLGISASLDSTLFVIIETANGGRLILEALGLGGKPSISLSASKIELHAISELLKELGMGFVQFPAGTVDIKKLTAKADLPKIEGELEVEFSDALVAAARWGAGKVSFALSAGFLVENSNIQLTDIKLTSAQSATALSCSGTWRDSALNLLDLKLAVGDARTLVEQWGLAAMDIRLAGEVKYDGDLALSFPAEGITVRGGGVVQANRLVYDPELLPFTLDPSELELHGSFHYNPAIFDLNVDSATLVTKGFCTKYGAFVSKAPTKISGKLNIAPAVTSGDFKLGCDGVFDAEASLKIPTRGAMTASIQLRSEDVNALMPVFYHPQTAEILKIVQPSAGAISIKANITAQNEHMNINYDAVLPPAEFKMEGFKDSIAGAKLNGAVMMGSDPDVRITVLGVLQGVSSLGDVATRAGIRIAPDGLIAVKVRDIDTILKSGAIDFEYKDSEWKLEASWKSLDLPALKGFAEKHELAPPTQLDLSGDFRAGSVKLSPHGYSVSVELAAFNLTYPDIALRDCTGMLSVSGRFEQMLPENVAIHTLTANTIQYAEVIKAHEIVAKDLVFELKKGNVSTAIELSGALSAGVCQLALPENLTVAGASFKGVIKGALTGDNFNLSSSDVEIEATSIIYPTLRATGISAKLHTGDDTQAGEVALTTSFGQVEHDSFVLKSLTTDGHFSFAEGQYCYAGKVRMDSIAVLLERFNAKTGASEFAFDAKYMFETEALEVKANYTLPFASGHASFNYGGEVSSATISAKLSNIQAALNAMPTIAELVPGEFDGEAELSAKADIVSGVVNAEFALSTAIAGYEISEPEIMGEGFGAKLSGSIQLKDGAVQDFKVQTAITVGDLLAGNYYFSIAEEFTASAQGSYGEEKGLEISSASLKFARLFDEIRINSASVAPNGDVTADLAISGLNIDRTIKFFYTEQLAKGEEVLYRARGTANGKMSLRSAGATLDANVVLDCMGFSCSLKPYRGATPIDLQTDELLQISAGFHAEGQDPRINAQLNAGKLFFGYGDVIGELETLSFGSLFDLSKGGLLADGVLKASGFAELDGPNEGVDILSLHDFELELPFRFANTALHGSELKEGILLAKSLSFAGYVEKDVILTLTVWDNLLRITEPIHLRSGDSEILISDFVINDFTLNNRKGGVKIALQHVSTQILLDSMGLDAFEGVIEGGFDGTIDGTGMSLKGSAVLSAFGGTVSITDPYFIAGRYSQFGFSEVIIENIDLLEMTSAFEGYAASVSGNISGYIKNFAYAYGSPSKFELWLHTDKKKGRKQLITAGVVNVIALNSSEVRTAMKIFNLTKFKYKYIRIGASLREGRLRVSSAPDGRPVEGEKESILLMGQRSGFFRLILRVAGKVEGDWRSIWSSIKSAVKSIGEGGELEVKY